MEVLMMIFGVGKELTATQMCARAAVVFVLTLSALRISGRRSLGQHSAFDLVVAVLLGAVTSRAVVGASAFLPTIAAGFTIVLLHRLVGWLSVASPVMDALLNGQERVLVREGERDIDQMKKALISPRDLGEAARLRGISDIAQCEQVCLERNGEISFLRCRSGDA